MAQIKLRTFLILISLLVSATTSSAFDRMKKIPICSDKEYLVKNYFLTDGSNESNKKDWHRYYSHLDESSGVVDISISLMREITVPEQVLITFTKDGQKKELKKKMFDLKRKDREFYLVDFKYKNEIPNPQLNPGILQMVLLKKNKPICRIQQIFSSLSNN